MPHTVLGEALRRRQMLRIEIAADRNPEHLAQSRSPGEAESRFLDSADRREIVIHDADETSLESALAQILLNRAQGGRIEAPAAKLREREAEPDLAFPVPEPQGPVRVAIVVQPADVPACAEAESEARARCLQLHHGGEERDMQPLLHCPARRVTRNCRARRNQGVRPRRRRAAH